MKNFPTLNEAISEIKRDLSRANIVDVTRVQQQTGLTLNARELLNYSYQIESGIPEHADQLVTIGMDQFPFFHEADTQVWETWLDAELFQRTAADQLTPQKPEPSDFHPALKHCKEGEHYSYTYPEIMRGGYMSIRKALVQDPDTRRAYFPFFEKHHAYRASEPTRVPCSIGYQALIRVIPGLGPHLMLLYTQRSADFDRFWLSDVWFARMFQLDLVNSLASNEMPDLKVGPFMHHITSLHSFLGDEEIY